MSTPSGGFKPREHLSDLWIKYTEQNEEKYFRKFVKDLVNQWESEVASTWGELVSNELNQDKNHFGPDLSTLPEELLPALSKFLFISRDEAEQGELNTKAVNNAKDIVKCLCIISRHVDNIPLVSSMDFIKLLTQTDLHFLHHLLEMESAFFTRKVKSEVTNQKLRSEIVDFIMESCHFLETIYDPRFRWRAFVEGNMKRAMYGEPTPISLHPESIPFLYESFETAISERFPEVAKELLTVFGAIISGAKHNSQMAISPATSKMLLKTVRDTSEGAIVHIAAIHCSARSIQILHEMNMDERQIDIVKLIEQYQQILLALAEKEQLLLSTMIEGVSMVTKVLDVKKSTELQSCLAKSGIIETLLTIVVDSKLSDDEKHVLMPEVIHRISQLLKNCDVASQRMLKIEGYQRLFDVVNTLGPPNDATLRAILSIATHGEDPTKAKKIRNIEPIAYLLKWLRETDYENQDLQVWLCEHIGKLCSGNIQNKMLCCDSGIITRIIEALQDHHKLHQNSAVELLRLVETLGTHSINPFELKQLISLLRLKESEEGLKFPYKSHVIHVISAMAKGDGYEAARSYFDFTDENKSCSNFCILDIRDWTSPSHGFTFQCWIRLEKLPAPSRKSREHKRRQLYSFYTSGGNGFEAFFTSDGILVAAVANKKEYLAVALKEHPIDDERWHCIAISHGAGKRPFGSSWVSFFIDGTKRLECNLKYPSLNEPFTYCQIGSPLQRSNIPALNPDVKPTFKEGLMDAIKVGIPGVINLPTLKSSQNDPHVQWTLIGLEDQLWGDSCTLQGQISIISCLNDALSLPQAKLIYNIGPNRSIANIGEEYGDYADLESKVVFCYSARAKNNLGCPNLRDRESFEAQVTVKTFSTQDVKDVINCIGGVQVLFPLLETAAMATESEAKDIGYLSLRTAESRSRRNSAEFETDWELLPSSSFSDWKLEQNAISGFLTLVKNLVLNHTINTEQLMRGGGVAIIGDLLQKARPELIDVNVLMASQLLVELAQSSRDNKLLLQIYQNILFDFRIWSKSEFAVQIGHIQYISTIIKDDRKYFRSRFGVQYLLDVVRKHYGGSTDRLSEEDCRTIRNAMFSLVKFFLNKDPHSKEVFPVIAFIISEKNQVILREMSELVAHYLTSKSAKDEVFLLMYESRKADLFHCLLLNRSFNHGLRKSFLRLIIILLRSNRVSIRHKHRMHLSEAKYIGYFHLLFKSTTRTENEEKEMITKEEVLLLMDELLLFDDSTSYQGILGLIHHLHLHSLDLKLEVARKVMTCLFSKNDVPQQFAKQTGWQDCLTRLLVKKVVKTEMEDSSEHREAFESAPLSPSHTGGVEASPKSYGPASDVVERFSATASKVVTDATNRVTRDVNYASEYVSDKVLATQDRVTLKMMSAHDKVHSKTHEIMEFVQSGFDDISGRRRRRSSCSQTSYNEDTTSLCERAGTPQYLQAFDNFGFEDLSFNKSSKSASSSSEDVSTSRNENNTSAVQAPLEDMDSSSVQDMELVNESLVSEEMKNLYTDVKSDDREEELCQLVINILFTIMWRGVQGGMVSSVDEIMKERGQVITSINMLGLNHELYCSHVELKRRIVELCVQAVLSDHQEAFTAYCYENTQSGQAPTTSTAEFVMHWVYDLVMLDQCANFSKKVSESLLDGVIGLMEKFAMFQDVGNDESPTLAGSCCKLALEVLLKCVECNEIEIRSMATAKLHTLVLTRENNPKTELAFLIDRVAKIIENATGSESDRSAVMPLMRSILEKSRDQLHIGTQLPSLNMRKPAGEFYDEFISYTQSEEWKYFLNKKIAPLVTKYTSDVLSSLSREMDTFWAECYERSQLAMHKRNREIGESKLKFISKYVEPFQTAVKNENSRYHNLLSQQRSNSIFIKKRWEVSKRLFFGPRGAWTSGDKEKVSTEHWKLSNNENLLRMRLKLIPNPDFDTHLSASAHRDNLALEDKSGGPDLLKLQLSKEALKSMDVTEEDTEDGLTEDELKSLAKEQMETANESSEAERMSERLLMSEDCELVTFMSVIKGKLELTTNYAYFFDSSQFKEGEERHDLRFSLNSLREMHLRRFNLRRTGIEFFMLDQTNYFLNFANNKRRNKVFSRIIGQRLPNLITTSIRSPGDILKASGLTQKWVNREISNFEYLMYLNTISGRTFNDLSQYPVFPWILADYSSETLDLNKPETFRDLAKPVGIQNPQHVEEVKSKYENFEDPCGIIAKFHYGTHYSNSAMVLHYLVRVEPFTKLHIELQSGRFDVADRQFHSIGKTWKSLYENLNDVKELIPEFFYFPEFLLNLNNFDLGKLQGKKTRVHDVVLPKWASNAYDFIRKHRLALESEFVSSQLHNWIDLIFGYKQKGPDAVEALNVFYYCSYEGAVNLDAISDPAEREAVEGMINNFGQTPSQLMKEPHPRRMSLKEHEAVVLKSHQTSSSPKADLFLHPSHWKPFMLEVFNERNPIIFVHSPQSVRNRPPTTDVLITISKTTLTMGLHSWQPYDRSGQNTFTLEPDISLTTNKPRKHLTPFFNPKTLVNNKLFAVSPDSRYIFSGGHWDNSLEVFSVVKARPVARVVRHIDVITCLSMDLSGNFIISGSRDTNSIVWETGISASMGPNPRPVQVLSGHDKPVACVALSIELDMAVSGSEDGSVNIYTVKEGQYIRTIWPPTFGSDIYTISQLALSSQGHVVFGGHSKDVHSLHVYTINGHLLTSTSVAHRVTVIRVTSSDHILTGDENGDLVLRDLMTPTVIRTLALHTPILDVKVAAFNSHVFVALRDGKLIIIGLCKK